MDEQQLASFVNKVIAPEVRLAMLVSTETNAAGQLLANVHLIGDRQVQLPVWISGRNFSPLRPGEVGIALLPRGDATHGVYLALHSHRGDDDWAGDTQRLHARDAALELRGDQGVNLQNGAKGAARVDDPVEITMGPADAAAVAELAAALLLTGAFVPTGAPPAPTPPLTTATFTGRITGGSADVLIGGD